jgi:hypothetical protein
MGERIELRRRPGDEPVRSSKLKSNEGGSSAKSKNFMKNIGFYN